MRKFWGDNDGFREKKQYLLTLGIKLFSEKYGDDVPVGNFNCHYLDDIFLAWMVGLEGEVEKYIPQVLAGIEAGIERNETLGESESYHRHRLHKYKALGYWALEGVNKADIWKEVCFYIKDASYKGTVWQKKQMATAYLDDYLAFCFLAGEYEEGKQEFQKYHGDKQVSLKKGTPKEFAYALCLRALSEGFEDEDLLKAGRRVLSNNLTRNWFGRGQIGQSVLWLNIVHWEVARSASPLEAVLKAYDDMPTLVKPS